MKRSDLNHLRRLLGWIRCDIGQSPAELQQTMINVADGLGHPEISQEAKARMVENYRRAEAIPLYVRAAVRALEKALAKGGPEGGAATPPATAESRAVVDVAPGVEGGPEMPLSDLAMEQGLAEVGITTWGPRAEDWAAGAEYAVRLMRECLPKAAAETLPDRPDVACNPAACRDSSAAPPALRRDDADGAGAAGQTDKDGVVDESPNLQGLPVDRSADLRGGGDCAQGVGVVSASPWYLWLERRYGPEIAARVIGETMEYDRQQRAGDDLPGAALASQKSEGEAC